MSMTTLHDAAETVAENSDGRADGVFYTDALGTSLRVSYELRQATTNNNPFRSGRRTPKLRVYVYAATPDGETGEKLHDSAKTLRGPTPETVLAAFRSAIGKAVLEMDPMEIHGYGIAEPEVGPARDSFPSRSATSYSGSDSVHSSWMIDRPTSTSDRTRVVWNHGSNSDDGGDINFETVLSGNSDD